MHPSCVPYPYFSIYLSIFPNFLPSYYLTYFTCTQSDQWRHYQLMKSCAREDHPFCSFSTGNADTLMKVPESLGLNPRDVVIDFYKKYYSSNIMKLAVYGKESLDVMQKWVEEKFSSIPDKFLTSPRFPSDPYRPEQLAKILEVVPVRYNRKREKNIIV